MLTADRNVINAWWPALVTAIDAKEAYCITQVNTPTPDPTAEALYVAAFNTLGTAIVNWLQKDRSTPVNELYMGLYGYWIVQSLQPNIVPALTDTNYSPLNMFDPSGYLNSLITESETLYYTTNTDTNYIDGKVTNINAQTAVDDVTAVRNTLTALSPNQHAYMIINMTEDVVTPSTALTKAQIRDKFYAASPTGLDYKNFIVSSGMYAAGVYAYPLDGSSPLFGQF